VARGLTLDRLSDAKGGVVTKQALSKYERGASAPSPRVLIALARALPRSEGPSRRRAFAALPREKRGAAPAKQAASAADFYAEEAVDSDDESVDY
jgi:transcriptional regulator with XRE-family HTH domain